MTDQKKLDKNLTPDVENPLVEKLLKNYGQEKSGDNLRLLIEALKDARLLVPANMNQDRQPVPCLIDTPEGGKLISGYTCIGKIPRESKHTVIVNMAFPAICNMVGRPHSSELGLILNPFTDNLVFRASLLQQLLREPEGGAAREASYEVSERRRFESVFLPRLFFERGQSLLEELCEKKEAYIDELFEEAYEQKRMYPYLPENFSVIVMNISEDLLIVRVDLPNRDLGEVYCEYIYLVWKVDAKRGRYFMVEREKGSRERRLSEIDEDGEHKDCGEAPQEGNELSRIIELAKDVEKN